jgi:hypothetical protein
MFLCRYMTEGSRFPAGAVMTGCMMSRSRPLISDLCRNQTILQDTCSAIDLILRDELVICNKYLET